MADRFSEAEMNKALFVNLVVMFNATAMQQLGKLVNPATGKAEVDLRGAQVSIDVLTMLSEKTKGNLDKEEERLLRDAISAIQLNYVETAGAAPKADSKKHEDESDRAPIVPVPGAAADGAVKSDEGDVEKKVPKFHKAYGEGS